MVDVTVANMSAALENRNQDAKINSMINKPSTEKELIALTRRAWMLYDNIFDEGKKISLSGNTAEHTEALHDIRTTRQLLRDEIIRQSVDNDLLNVIEKRLKALYNRDITDTELKFDLSGSAVGTMKTIIQTLEKNYKIHAAAVLEIARMPNPAAALHKLFSMINNEPTWSTESESIIKALSELLTHSNIKGYASTALKEHPELADSLTLKLSADNKHSKFLTAFENLRHVEPQPIYNSNYLPMEEDEAISIPEHGDLGLDFAPEPVKPAKTNTSVNTSNRKKPPAEKSESSRWAPLKRFVKEHKVFTAICIGVAILGVAAIITAIVFSAGMATAPIAAGAAAGVSALAAAATTSALIAGTATAAAVGVAGGIFGAALAVIGATVFKKQYDKKTAQWEREVALDKFKYTYQDPTPKNTPIFETDAHNHAPKTQNVDAEHVDVKVEQDETEGEGEAQHMHN